ncbi:MAG TPA: hypothetical protein VF988_14345, partial [Verrucomicrobiae bacterium]
NLKKHSTRKPKLRNLARLDFGEPAVVGRVTPCAPSWYNRMRLLAGGGAQRSARPTAPNWRLTVSISTPTSVFGFNLQFNIQGSRIRVAKGGDFAIVRNVIVNLICSFFACFHRAGRGKTPKPSTVRFLS